MRDKGSRSTGIKIVYPGVELENYYEEIIVSCTKSIEEIKKDEDTMTQNMRTLGQNKGLMRRKDNVKL